MKQEESNKVTNYNSVPDNNTSQKSAISSEEVTLSSQLHSGRLHEDSVLDPVELSHLFDQRLSHNAMVYSSSVSHNNLVTTFDRIFHRR